MRAGSATVIIGIVDSGGPAGGRAGALAFDADGAPCPAGPDRLGHGTAVAATIARALPCARLVHAQVFGARPVTSAIRVAAALDWLAADGGTAVICLSLGLAADRSVLARAVARARTAGVALVAAHPARGPAPFPAAYEGVIAATGDARCGWDEVSQIGPRLFGAWCNAPGRSAPGIDGGNIGGASIGTARLAAHVAALLGSGTPADTAAIAGALAGRATHRGPERRRA